MLSTAAQEKIFARLLSNPANTRCADCNAKSPTWASIDFGVFVCLNCSGAHRALGPSVTRVRSTKLDTWQTEWVQLMELGNELCNTYWLANIGGAAKINTNSALDQIKRFVSDKYLKRKYAKSGQSDPVANLKNFRALKKQNNDIHKIDFKKLKDQDKFKTVSGGFNFQPFSLRKNSESEEKAKKKESFDIFNFDEAPKHTNNHTHTITTANNNINNNNNHPGIPNSFNLYQNNEPKKNINHAHSLDFYTISHGSVTTPLNFNFHQPTPHQNNHTTNFNLHPTFNELSSNFPQPHQNQFHTQQPSQNTFNFANVFNQSHTQQQTQNQSSFNTKSSNNNVTHSFDVFGGAKSNNQQSNQQQPVNTNINMYGNNINFSYVPTVVGNQHKTEQKKDPFGAIDEFNF